MAAGDGKDFETELTEMVLCCQVCMEDFDTKIRVPRVLPCHHAFCAMCLESLQLKEHKTCPNCRAEIPSQGKFPVEITRMAILELKLAKQNKVILCQGCEEGIRATSHCQDCKEFLCEDCSIAHARVKYTRNHVLVPLAEETNKSSKKPLNTTELCDRHKDEKLKLFCKSCSECVCSMCALTLHKTCEDMVALGTILHEKKEEMRTLCKELDEMQEIFQQKSEESDGNMKTAEANLLKAVQLVEGAFSEVIQSAVQRQEEVLRDLRVHARSDQLLLEQQATAFQSMQAEVQAAAQNGRKCSSQAHAALICRQVAQLNQAMTELRAQSKTRVTPASDYKISLEKVAKVKEMMAQIGYTDSQPVLNPDQDLSAFFLPFQLDAPRCGAGCWVEKDRRFLSNQPGNASSEKKQRGFSFPGTCGTEALQGARIYWQINFKATPRPRYRDNDILVEVGVATMPALQSCKGDKLISCGPHTAFTAVFYTVSGTLRAVVFYKKSNLLTTDSLEPTVPHRSIDITLGFLLDTNKSCLHIVDAKSARALWFSTIDLSTPLWPVVRVLPKKEGGADVRAEVQTGQQIVMNEDLQSLLWNLM